MNKRGGVLSDSALEIGAGVLVVIIFLTFLSFVVPRSSGEGFKVEVIAKDIVLEINALDKIKEDVDTSFKVSREVNLDIKNSYVKVDGVKITTSSNLEIEFKKQLIRKDAILLFSK